MRYAERSSGSNRTDAVKGNLQRTFVLLIWRVLNVHFSYKCYYLKMIALSMVGVPILMIIRCFGLPEVQKKVLYDTVEIDSLDKMHMELDRMHNYTNIEIVEKVLFTPNLNPYVDIMALTAKKLKLKDGYQACETEQEMERLIQYEGMLAGVVFRGNNVVNTTVSDLPNILDYVLRFPPFLNTGKFEDANDIWATEELYPPVAELLVRGPRTSSQNTNFAGVPPGYIQEGFLPLQHAIAMSYLELKTGHNSKFFPRINMMKFPYRQYIYDKMFLPIKLWLPIVFLIAYVVPSYMMVHSISDEFERGFMKTLKINYLNWCAWAVILFAVQVFITFLIMLILGSEWYGGAIIKCSEWAAIMAFLLCYIWANCAFVLMLTVVVIPKRSNVKYGMVLHLLTYLPFPLLFIFYFDIPLSYKLLGSLFLNTGLALGINIIINLEHTNEGLRWRNYNRPLFAADGLSILHVNEMLLLSSVICICILLYWDNRYSPDVSAMNVDKQSMSKKWYYPLSNLFSFIRRRWERRNKHSSVFKVIGSYIIRALTTHEDDLYQWQTPRLRRPSKGTLTERHSYVVTDPDIEAYQRRPHTPLRNVPSVTSVEDPPPKPKPKHRHSKRVLAATVAASSSDSLREYPESPPMWIPSKSSITTIDPLSLPSDRSLSLLQDQSSFESEVGSMVYLPSQATVNDPLKAPGAGIEVIDVSKVIGFTTYLKNINMTIHSNEITVILIREQTAGRLLLSKIIAGVIKPTTGKVLVNGVNIRECKDNDPNRLISILPTQSIVINQLTICENFYFYLNLRGVRSSSQIDREISKYLNLMCLDIKMINEFAEHLNENMARRLSLCCALCGGKHGIIVDEPTMGLDQSNRHHMWDLLISEARSRVIIVNTSYCDEAETLGDRIALINCGQVMCYGPTKDLLNAFCNNYHLICEKSKANDVNWGGLLQLLYHHMPEGARIVKHTGNHIDIRIPEEHGVQFAQLLADLERLGKHNGIAKFWVQLKTLRQVFHCSFIERKEYLESLQRHTMQASRTFDETTTEPNQNKRKSLTFQGLLRKRIIHLRHYFWVPLLVLALIAISLSLESHSTHLSHLRGMNLSVHSYPNSVAMMKINSEVKQPMPSYHISQGVAQYQKFLMNARHRNDHTFKYVRGRRELIQYILFQQLVSETSVETFYVAGADIYEKVITCFWNNKLLHASPISLNLVHNGIARHYIGPDAEIRVQNHPVPFTNRHMLDLITMRYRMNMGLGNLLIVIICFALVLMIAPVISDHNVGTRHLIYMGGANTLLYWTIQFICDMVFYIVGVIFLVSFLLLYDYVMEPDNPEYDDVLLIFLIVVVFILFGLAVLPFIYILTVLFGQILHDFMGTLLILMGSSILLMLVIPTMIMDIEHLLDLYFVFCWSPTTNLYRALKYLHIERALLRACDVMGGCGVIADCCDMPGYLSYQYPGILVQIIVLVLEIIVYGFIFILLIYIELGWSTWRSKRRERLEDEAEKKKNRNIIETHLDYDVLFEKQRVNQLGPSDLKRMPMVLNNVSKRLKTENYLNEVTLAVDPLDVFGLVGIFGSGKSKIIELATGVYSIDRGDIFIHGVSVRNNQKLTRKMIAYCPRSNSLIESMTVSEILHFYCAIHGRSSEFVSTIIREVTVNLSLATELDKLVKDLCFATRRKIMVAIALTSNAKVVMMDEPTRGLDAESRLQIWRMIHLLHNRGRTVIIATDSMDECIALCNRIAIMVNGSLISVGSVDYLTSKFSKGSILKIRAPGPNSYKGQRYSIEETSSSSRASHLGFTSVSSDESVGEIIVRHTLQEFTDTPEDLWIERCQRHRDIKLFIQEELPHARLEEEYRNILTYYIPFKTIPLSNVFEAMEAAKHVFHIKSYRVTRTSLMEIYDSFVKAHVHFWVKKETGKPIPSPSGPIFMHN